MEVLVERQSALDVHKAQVTACVRVPNGDGGRLELIEQFQTTVPGLLAMADWLRAHEVTHVVMEATGDYWKPVWHLLEEDFELMLVNARHVKQVPGRKTDVFGCGVAVSAGRSRAAVSELRATQADP
jgi:transposase